ncbi:hypothetical protein RJP21_29880 [Paenibacillus sp. VCA1]|uniref:hypothetical protein n=1 Tax=Paenibacillus sp. VCA1 TaxID=3039148 RepID=UPI0028727D87|nr:hypothetical protein [Paenibacillus sp. VCA1]MDR9857805.1 hypothetical protein [Paenibacillus sp. VCA1]
MIVKVKEIPVRHNGRRHLSGEEFKIEQEAYAKIQKFVDVVKEDSDSSKDNPNNGQESGGQQEPKKIEDMTVQELKEFAGEMEIDLGDATKKDEILSRIQAALKE